MSNFTKKAIKATFLQLLDEKPLSQITVKQIVEACGINRNSFYYHYQDLPALIEEIITEEADRIIADHPTVDSIRTALTAAVDFASRNRRGLLHIYNSVNRDIFEHYLWKVCDHVVRAYSSSATAGLPMRDTDREILGRFYRCACFGLVIDWMNSRMTDDVTAMIDRFCDLHRGLPEEMARRSAEE